MAKREPKPELIDEIEGGAERLASWIGENALAVALAVAVILGGALTWGVYDSWATGREEAASTALDAARTAYFGDLGAGPLTRAEPELANPAAAQAIREEIANLEEENRALTARWQQERGAIDTIKNMTAHIDQLRHELAQLVQQNLVPHDVCGGHGLEEERQLVLRLHRLLVLPNPRKLVLVGRVGHSSEPSRELQHLHH